MINSCGRWLRVFSGGTDFWHFWPIVCVCAEHPPATAESAQVGTCRCWQLEIWVVWTEPVGAHGHEWDTYSICCTGWGFTRHRPEKVFPKEGDGYAHSGMKNTYRSVIKWLVELGLKSDEQGWILILSPHSPFLLGQVTSLPFVISIQWEFSMYLPYWVVIRTQPSHKD